MPREPLGSLLLLWCCCRCPACRYIHHRASSRTSLGTKVWASSLAAKKKHYTGLAAAATLSSQRAAARSRRATFPSLASNDIFDPRAFIRDDQAEEADVILKWHLRRAAAAVARDDKAVTKVSRQHRHYWPFSGNKSSWLGPVALVLLLFLLQVLLAPRLLLQNGQFDFLPSASQQCPAQQTSTVVFTEPLTCPTPEPVLEFKGSFYNPSAPRSMALAEEARRVAAEFEYPPEEVNKGVKAFLRQMQEGLQKDGTSISQIPTYVTAVPNGTEKVGSHSFTTFCANPSGVAREKQQLLTVRFCRGYTWLSIWAAQTFAFVRFNCTATRRSPSRNQKFQYREISW